MPDYFEFLNEPFFEWVDKYTLKNEITPHQIIAYLNALKKFSDYEYLKDRLVDDLISWAMNPEENSRRQILIWARLEARLEWCVEASSKDIQVLFKNNFLKCLREIPQPPQSDWYNIPIILEAMFKLSPPSKKQIINDKISSEMVPSTFFKLRDIFDFLSDHDELIEIQNEVAAIKEKCRQSPTKELCQTCMDEPQGKCWIRILAKITGVAPWTHGGFEVADVVVYMLEQGIYFVIKSENIMAQRKGEILYRQCTQLFNNDHALVLYWNPLDTHPSVIENIRKISTSMKTNPRFEVVDKKYIRQIYKYYIQEIESRERNSEKRKSLLDF